MFMSSPSDKSYQSLDFRALCSCCVLRAPGGQGAQPGFRACGNPTGGPGEGIKIGWLAIGILFVTIRIFPILFLYQVLFLLLFKYSYYQYKFLQFLLV